MLVTILTSGEYMNVRILYIGTLRNHFLAPT
jgi:hypothetical protein